MIESISTPFLCSDIENQNLKINAENYLHLKNLILTDCSPDGKKSIDILIGAVEYYCFIYGNIICGKIYQPVAVQSNLQWLVTGCFENVNANTFVNFHSTHVLRMTTNVITENFISKINVISKDEKIALHSVENPFDTGNYCHKKKVLNSACMEKCRKDSKYNKSPYISKLTFTDNSLVLSDRYLLTKKNRKIN